MLHTDLHAALNEVALSDFHQDILVVPCIRIDDDGTGTYSPVAYVSEEDHAHASDDWEWTEDDGIRDQDSVSEVSPLLDLTFTLTAGAQVAELMPESARVLEAGTHTVTFAFAAVRDASLRFREETQDYVDDEGSDRSDNLAGWIIVAVHNASPDVV